MKDKILDTEGQLSVVAQNLYALSLEQELLYGRLRDLLIEFITHSQDKLERERDLHKSMWNSDEFETFLEADDMLHRLGWDELDHMPIDELKEIAFKITDILQEVEEATTTIKCNLRAANDNHQLTN